MIDLSNVSDIRWPAFYTCTGEESGICDVEMDGQIFKIYINSARAGAQIMYLGGHFYAITDGIDLTQPEEQTSKVDPLPVPETPQHIELENPETGSSTNVIFDTPDVETIPGQSIEYHAMEENGVVTVTYRLSGTQQWIEIPVLTDEDVIRINNLLRIVSANITQVGDTVYLS